MGWLGDEIEKMIPRLLMAKYVALKEAKTKAKFLVLNKEKRIVKSEDEKVLVSLLLVKHVKILVSVSLVKMSVVFLMLNLMIQPFFCVFVAVHSQGACLL